jgi:hypothetical protein
MIYNWNTGNLCVKKGVISNEQNIDNAMTKNWNKDQQTLIKT